MVPKTFISVFWGLICSACVMAQPASPLITRIGEEGAEKVIEFEPYPGAEAFQLFYTPDLLKPFQPLMAGDYSGYQWRGETGGAQGFFKLEVTPLDSSRLFGGNVLHRIAYGPTPDLIERVLTGPKAIGPEAYIEEQLAPEKIVEELEINRLVTDPGWQFASVTGTASSSVLYIYLTEPGEIYLDDLRLVRGAEAGVGLNLIGDGEFERELGAPWMVSENLMESRTTAEQKRSGERSLHLKATRAGSTRTSAIWQTISPSLASGQQYTLSHWYLPSPSSSHLVLRLSGSGIVSSPDTLLTKLSRGQATIDELRAWFCLHAIQSERQLFEVLTQFWDNHFTTQYSKSRDGYLANYIGGAARRLASTDFEFRELVKWREVLLNPNGNFYDLLKISAESPAMVIYLDTTTSTRAAPNENYSRELVELFTMGVDNGYDQEDIEQMSRAWTGWRVDKLPIGQERNPFSARVADRREDPGYWTLRYQSDRHDTGSKTIFRNRKVDARFGPPYAGRNYELRLPARSGNAGMQDGYEVVAHLANLPYTQEYISVKLCQWFVHENFAHGVYDYTEANLSPEAKLVRACMRAWETPAEDGRQGNLRNVLRVIFYSDLFRNHAASRQKVKTPLEFVVSGVRALRAETSEGKFTAETDGYSLLGPLSSLDMDLFDREDPDGWSELGRDWVSTSALVDRMRFVQNLLMANSNSNKARDFGSSRALNVSDPVGLIKLKLPESQWGDAEAILDFFLQILFLGEGRANLDLDRQAALLYLNSNHIGLLDSPPFARLAVTSPAYDERVRGMVAVLMCSPRFQEQ
jgi:uncharacterized protein (DUF1800 family)